MRIDIITIFPEMFPGVLESSIIKRAQSKRKVRIDIHNLRDYSEDKHKKVDAPPYGGGPGMVFRCEPIFNAVETIRAEAKPSKPRVILLSPQGKKFTQKHAVRLAKYKYLILVCGHYEGVDQRVADYLIDEEISIGDYVLTGGEIPALVLVDAVVRLIPGVLGDNKSLECESFKNNLFDHPHYTRPKSFRGKKVPLVLLSGNHKEIQAWRVAKARELTRKRRKDLRA